MWKLLFGGSPIDRSARFAVSGFIGKLKAHFLYAVIYKHYP